MIKCLFTKAIQKKKLFLKKLEFSQKLKISKIHKISENFCLKHIKTVQNYLMSDKVCFFKHKNSKFLNNSCITENECVIAFLKSLCVGFLIVKSFRNIFNNFYIVYYLLLSDTINKNLSGTWKPF